MDSLISELNSRGITGVAISEFLGVTKATVSRWKNGSREPTSNNLEKLYRLLEDEALPKDYKSLDIDYINKLITLNGGVTKCARVIGKTVGLIYAWKYGRSRPDDLDIEKLLKKVVS